MTFHILRVLRSAIICAALATSPPTVHAQPSDLQANDRAVWNFVSDNQGGGYAIYRAFDFRIQAYCKNGRNELVFRFSESFFRNARVSSVARAELFVDGTVYDTPAVAQLPTGSAVLMRVSDDAISALRAGSEGVLRIPVLYRSSEVMVRIQFGLNQSSNALGSAQCRRSQPPPEVAERRVQNPDQLAGLMKASSRRCDERRLGTAITTRSLNVVNPPARLIWGLNAAHANTATHLALTETYDAYIRSTGCESREYRALIEDAVRFIERY